MTREKKKAPPPTRGVAALARRAKRERAQQFVDGVWQNLNALKAAPKVKHKTYFESVENSDKRKKLEYQITTERTPPPGFTFIPIGSPELTQACKDLSREQDAMIFIVSDSQDPNNLEHHMNRAGYHFRETIVDVARDKLGVLGDLNETVIVAKPNEPEPIPKTQKEINDQADAVLRDLFPRVPHIDRFEIIQHAFKKDGKFHGDYKVGMAKELTLARRVQLAALAHIRHTKTRYDSLLKETDWANARKAVEKPCLDVIVKWRGDEETGRDQLDEILREVIELSDTDTDTEDETPSPGQRNIVAPPASLAPVQDAVPNPLPVVRMIQHEPIQFHRRTPSLGYPAPHSTQRVARSERRTARKAALRFRRYAAAAESLPDNIPEPAGQLNVPSRMDHPHIRDVEKSPSSNYARHHAHLLPPAPLQGGAAPTYTDDPPWVGPPAGGPRSGPASPMPRNSRVVRHGSPRNVLPTDGTRPKVDLSRFQGPAPLSPARTGLQDFLVPSVEPASPGTHQLSHKTAFISLRDGGPPNEAPRAIPGTMRFRSPQFADARDTTPKRHRVVTYFPEDYQTRPADVLIPVGVTNRGRASRLDTYNEGKPGRSEQAESSIPRYPPAFPARELRYYPREEPAKMRDNIAMVDGADIHGFQPREMISGPNVGDCHVIRPAAPPNPDPRNTAPQVTQRLVPTNSAPILIRGPIDQRNLPGCGSYRNNTPGRGLKESPRLGPATEHPVRENPYQAPVYYSQASGQSHEGWRYAKPREAHPIGLLDARQGAEHQEPPYPGLTSRYSSRDSYPPNLQHQPSVYQQNHHPTISEQIPGPTSYQRDLQQQGHAVAEPISYHIQRRPDHDRPPACQDPIWVE